MRKPWHVSHVGPKGQCWTECPDWHPAQPMVQADQLPALCANLEYIPCHIPLHRAILHRTALPLQEGVSCCCAAEALV